MKRILLFITFLLLFTVFNACSSDIESTPYVMPYASETELSSRESPASLIPDRSSWMLQYPSGIEGGGIFAALMDNDFKNKYFSRYTDSKGRQYIRFSLDASDQGKTTNGSSVRVELAQTGYAHWALSGTHSMEYTFWGTCTDIYAAKFTVGQFLASQLPDPDEGKATDRPLCRIENDCGNLVAYVRNYYEKNTVDISNGDPIKIQLGRWIPDQETTIKIQTVDKTLTIYRDGAAKGSTTFTDKVRTDQRNYFKLGIYYQNKDSPKIFSEIFVRDMKVE